MTNNLCVLQFGVVQLNITNNFLNYVIKILQKLNNKKLTNIFLLVISS